MKVNIYYFLIALAFAGTSCSDEDKALKEYHEGAFVVNEGAFQAGNGTITYYNEVLESAAQNIFINPEGDFAGDVAQSLTFHGDEAYIVINGDSKIEIADAVTFKSIRTITSGALDKPRYVEIIDNKAYISVWGAYDESFSLVDSYVMVYDLESKEVIKTIDTDEGTENLLYDGETLFAANFNYGSSNTVAAINPSTNTLIDHIEVEAGPAGMVIDANGKLWVVCVGAWNAVNGQLFRINATTLEVEEEIEITGIPGIDITTTTDKQNIIYSVGTSVFSLPIAATEESDEPVFEAEEVTSLYSLTVDQTNGNIWIGDAPSFSSAGKVYIYSSTGVLSTSFNAGIGPTQVVFKP